MLENGNLNLPFSSYDGCTGDCFTELSVISASRTWLRSGGSLPYGLVSFAAVHCPLYHSRLTYTFVVTKGSDLPVLGLPCPLYVQRAAS